MLLEIASSQHTSFIVRNIFTLQLFDFSKNLLLSFRFGYQSGARFENKGPLIRRVESATFISCLSFCLRYTKAPSV